MARTTKKSESKDIESADTEAPRVVRVEEPAPRPVVVLPKVEKLISFDQYAKRKGIPDHHMPGMLAFVKDSKNRSMEGWDSVFKDY